MGGVVLPILYAACVAAIACGLGAAFGVGSIVRRLSGIAIAHVGAAVLVVALSGGAALALAVVTTGAAATLLGGAIAARLNEGYGAAEDNEINAADRRDESVEG